MQHFATICPMPAPLLSLLSCITAIVVATGDRISQAEEQQRIVSKVEKIGGFVTYDYMLNESGALIPEAPPKGPALLRAFLGKDFFSKVVRVNFDCTDVTDDDLKMLTGLVHLRQLNLFNTKTTDAGLANLRQLTQLERLELGGVTEVSDLGLSHLAGLLRLRYVHLSECKVTDDGIRALHKALPNLITPSVKQRTAP